MQTEILYPCIHCGILPSFYGYKVALEISRFYYDCPNCEQECSAIYYFDENFNEFKQRLKETWNIANNPEKLLKLFNPCIQHKNCKLMIKKSIDIDLGSPYYYLCARPNEDEAHFFPSELPPEMKTPKSLRDAWNEANPLKEKINE